MSSPDNRPSTRTQPSGRDRRGSAARRRSAKRLYAVPVEGGPVSERNVELLRRAWAAYDRGDAEAFAACLTDDWREYDAVGEVGTLEDERRTMAAHQIAFPDKHTEIHRVVADDE